MPGVELTPRRGDPLRARCRRGQPLDDLLRERLAQERHEVARRISGHAAKRVPLQDGRELGSGPDEHVDVEAELGCELTLEGLFELGTTQRALEDDVPALQVGPHFSVAVAGQQLPERRHPDPALRPEVDAAEQRDIRPSSHHARSSQPANARIWESSGAYPSLVSTSSAGAGSETRSNAATRSAQASGPPSSALSPWALRRAPRIVARSYETAGSATQWTIRSWASRVSGSRPSRQMPSWNAASATTVTPPSSNVRTTAKKSGNVRRVSGSPGPASNADP